MTVRPRTCSDIRAQLHEERSWRITRSERITKVLGGGGTGRAYDNADPLLRQREYAEGVARGLSIALQLLTQISA